MNPRKSLVAQFLLGGSLLLLCVSFLVISQRHASEAQMNLVNWQSQVGALKIDVENLQKQSRHYKTNAPRDFESYNRDVAVFYQQLIQQVSLIDESIFRMASIGDQLNESVVGKLFSNDEMPIDKAYSEQASWQLFWATFKNNLNEQIGDSREPRLEWGVDHIIATQDNVNQRIARLSQRIHDANKSFNEQYQTVSTILLISVIAIILLTLALFAVFVIRPIVATTKVCEDVAAGDYGKKVVVNGTGETKNLQEAFNDLSSRSKLLMELLADINKPGSVADKLHSIYSSGKDALNCSWIGLMAMGEQRADLHSSVPTALDNNFRHRHVSLNKSFGRDLQNAVETRWLDLPELRQLSMKRHDERFLRELHKNTMARHIVGYSFKCPKHNEFILMFACNLEEGFSRQQIDLIKALSTLMADGIISGLDYKEVKKAV